MPWYVLYTKPRNEKKIAERLEEKGIKVYCPLQEHIRQWSDRKKKVTEPVFRSYVFVWLQEYKKEQAAVLETPGAVRFLWWLGAPGVVREEEIQAIRHFLEEYKDAPLTASLKEVREGAKVRVGEGPFKSKQGTVVRIKGAKAILYIDSLGWQVTAELPLHILQQDPSDIAL